jgi:protein involved in polysaccharide export with SLBB domain
VLIPGKYSFTRSEKLQDIIKRAGGLSDVAFPLGAKLHRVSAKELEKNTNNILADQLEDSILNLAQSSLEGAGDQVKVVLGYATQLRNQPTEGRMAVNILDDNPSNPIFLEDGDTLTVPKRPSHVSVVGSVQRSTLATYVPGQNYSNYIKFAGGTTKVADIRKAYMLLPNGESRQLNKTTVIPVGSTIIIPPKLDRLSILGGTDIISKVLNNISNSVLSIKNVD